MPKDRDGTRHASLEKAFHNQGATTEKTHVSVTTLNLSIGGAHREDPQMKNIEWGEAYHLVLSCSLNWVKKLIGIQYIVGAGLVLASSVLSALSVARQRFVPITCYSFT